MGSDAHPQLVSITADERQSALACHVTSSRTAGVADRIMSRLPDFLIAGAPRSGSTTLFRLIDDHPSIFMARPKEICFFNGGNVDDVQWYSEHFAGAGEGQMAGEATPWYMHDPVAVRAMETVVPDAMIIVILRDPVDRTYSHYWMERIRGRANASFEEFLDSTDVLDIGRYVDHLMNLSRHFRREQILVLFHQDLRRAPEGLYSEVCEFLSIDDSHTPNALGKTVNPYVEFRSLRVRRWAKGLPPSLSAVRRALDRLNTRTNVWLPWAAGWLIAASPKSMVKSSAALG